MAARTKRRAKFDFRGRPFVWWIDGDRYLRISSLDKKFIVALALGADRDGDPAFSVIGQEFCGIDRSEQRPVWLAASWPVGTSMGACVDELLRWSFDPTHELVRLSGPPRFY